ncbi:MULTISPECIES: lipocalin-like domain-containing protein [Streptomyces]|uniref:lipocalin-like domain-containing protein n=1 Tax=Streptomyces TaxID=1883 RepID=UPI00163D0516|nr:MULTISPECIES: lipocalin-like domain-containing protein [Streptomyces]MBC2876905.1 lipocalin-like domain-containing protein [Streptomyces sp. TYQ1024]UBI35932.1 lipocalin-like domain-containing protein [Streptomyces mobaraensis]UKW28525.1 lipocalin-like domain-containing protein [Streptomyces sp. TYQ1024]
MERSDLSGVWHLSAFHDLGPDDERLEGPLGPGPRGLLLYSDDGHMSVSIMRTAPSTRPPSTPVPLDFMGYAGRWRLDGDRVIHSVAITHTPRLRDTDETREVRFGDGRLSLYGTVTAGGRTVRRVLEWDRTGEWR